MKRIVISGPKKTELIAVEKTPVGPKDVSISVKACGICGSDLNFYKYGKLTPEAPDMILPIGHEFSGVIDEVGSEVNGLNVGDKVSVNPAAGGNIGFGGQEGAFCPSVTIKEAKENVNVFRLPKDTPFEMGALLEPLNVAYHCVKRTRLKPKDKVTIIGAGPIGLCVLVCLKYLGYDDIIISDLSEYRLNVAKKLGATTTINAGEVDVYEEIGKVHGTITEYFQTYVGSDVFIEASGAPIIDGILKNAKRRAILSFVAASKKPIEVDFSSIMARELELVGSQMYSDDFAAPIEILEKVDLKPLISHYFSLEEFNKALETTSNATEAAKVMITFP